MASCLPMSAMTVASWLMLPLWKCCASHRSRITEVGLALDAKKLMCLQRRSRGEEHRNNSEGTMRPFFFVVFIKSSDVHRSKQTVSHLLYTNRVLGKPFQPVFYCATASHNSVNVKFYCVLYCYIQICRVGALSKKMIKGVRTQSSS